MLGWGIREELQHRTREIAVDYVARLTFRPSVGSAERDAALMRRTTWNYPSGIRPIAEYWPMSSDVQVVTIFSSDDIAAVWEVVAEWEDVFDIDVSPAISAEDGLKVGPEVFGRLQRLQS
jgi:hypothetical protein